MAMTSSRELYNCQYDISENENGSVTIRIQGRMDSSTTSYLIRDLGGRIKATRPHSLNVDLQKVTYLDDFGALVLVELKKIMRAGKGEFNVKNASDNISEILGLFDFESLEKKSAFVKRSRPNIIIRLGAATMKYASDMKYMISFVGSVCLAMIHICIHPASLRKEDTILYMQKTGVDALPIVGLISFLLGLIMAFMSSFQLEQFGANIYVASLVSLSMVRELGPIMTAIIVAGRSGSSFAAEIGTMKISEEIDALFTMGFDPTRFLVIPKIIAAAIMVPFLTMFSDLFAILGGLLVGVSMLDLTANAYITQTIKTLTLFDIFWGLLKSLIFALLIAWIGCFRGFRVRGGAAAVGQATTSAVVSSIFLIIVTDSIFAVILRYWG